MKKKRIDNLLVEKGLAESRSQAQRLVMAGQVRANGQVVPKSSVTFQEDVVLSIDAGPEYVSRGGEKLASALSRFEINVRGLICADVGASTGGFTDCLLKNGAQKVYSIDVGKGILHWKLRQDARVLVMEGVNARYVNSLPERIDLVTIDVSFISVRVMLPVVKNWLEHQNSQVILLIKPQFEAGRDEASRGKGVIRDPDVHQRVLQEVLTFAQDNNFELAGLIKSPIKGPKGNTEFLAWLKYPGEVRRELQDMIGGLF